MRRRVPGLLVVVVALVCLVAFGRDTPEVELARFSVPTEGWMPAAPARNSLTESWFCPGVPATGDDGVEGEIVVVNRSDGQLTGTVLLINDAGESRRLRLSIEPWTSGSVALHERLPSDVVGAVVEIEGGGALVEQHAYNPDGDSFAPCPNATSTQWYFADGFTVEGSLDHIILANPFEHTVVASMVFATEDGPREGLYPGLTVPPRSIRVIDLGAPGAGAQNEPVLAVRVEATRGQLVVGRAQAFEGGGRSGTQVTVGSPATREQWWFASGQKGGGVTEEYVIYNPTTDQVEVDALFIGIDTPVYVEAIVAPAREVVVFRPASEPNLPEGDHAVVFHTSPATARSIVVERVTTRSSDDGALTGVLAGAMARHDGHVAATWYVPEAPSEPAERALLLYNVDNDGGTVTVSVVGSSGPVPVDSLTDLAYGPARRLEIDLTDPLVAGRELIIEATTRVLVERSFPSGVDDLRTPSWAIPLG